MDFNFRSINWKTSSAGITTAIVSLIGFITTWIETGHQPNIAITTATVSAIVTAVGFLYSRDSDKTSEEVGADVWSKERSREELKELSAKK